MDKDNHYNSRMPVETVACKILNKKIACTIIRRSLSKKLNYAEWSELLTQLKLPKKRKKVKLEYRETRRLTSVRTEGS